MLGLGLGLQLGSQVAGGAGAPPPDLVDLTLSTSEMNEGTAAGVVIAAIIGATAGSTLTLVDDAGGRFAIASGNLVAGLTATDYEVATSHTITIRETLAGSSNSPHDTVLAISVLHTDFVMTAETTAADETFALQCQNVGTFNATVDWGDGSSSTITAWNDANLTHTYAVAGIHRIKVRGQFPNICYANYGDCGKVRTVENLGVTGWEILGAAFYGCTGMTSFVAGYTDTSAVAVFRRMFRACPVLAIIDLTGMSTASGTDMTDMFYQTATSIGSITPVGIDAFAIGSVTSFGNFAGFTNFATATYDAILIAWDAQDPVNSLAINFGVSQYTGGGAAAAARASLIANDLWTITDGGVAA